MTPSAAVLATAAQAASALGHRCILHRHIGQESSSGKNQQGWQLGLEARQHGGSHLAFRASRQRFSTLANAIAEFVGALPESRHQRPNRQYHPTLYCDAKEQSCRARICTLPVEGRPIQLLQVSKRKAATCGRSAEITPPSSAPNPTTESSGRGLEAAASFGRSPPASTLVRGAGWEEAGEATKKRRRCGRQSQACRWHPPFARSANAGRE